MSIDMHPRQDPVVPVVDSTPAQLARVETKLDQIIQRDQDHELRIRNLERALYRSVGLASALGTAIGTAIAGAAQAMGS